MAEESTEKYERKKGRLPPHLMEQYDQTNYLTLVEALHLGARLEYLRYNGSERIEIKQTTVQDLLEEIARTLDSRQVESKVTGLITQYLSKIEQQSEQETLTEEQLSELETKISSWVHLLARELNEERRIPAADAGILDISKLSDSPEDLFQESVWGWLDDRPRSDLREACKTITVGCSTSSVMLSLRAVEHCLRKWYEQQNETLDAAWGRVLDQLMEEYTEDDKKNDTVLTQLSDLPPVLSTLYYLKEKRNEVNHPEKSPSPREARRTLIIVASTITEIHNEMRSEAREEARSTIEGTNGRLGTTTREITSEEEELLGLIQEAEHRSDDMIDKSTIIDMASDLGLAESEVRSMMRELLMSGRMYEPAEGKVKTI
jgi:hypothetical protein